MRRRKYKPEKLLDIFLEREIPATTEDFVKYGIKELGISRKTVYNYIKELKGRGLVKSLGGKPEKFMLSHPPTPAEHFQTISNLMDDIISGLLMDFCSSMKINEFIHVLFFSRAYKWYLNYEDKFLLPPLYNRAKIELHKKIDELGRKIQAAIQTFEKETGYSPVHIFYTRCFFDIRKYVEDVLRRDYGKVSDEIIDLCLLNGVETLIKLQIKKLQEKMEELQKVRKRVKEKEKPLKQIKGELYGMLETISVHGDIHKKRRKGLIKLIDEEIILIEDFIKWMGDVLKKVHAYMQQYDIYTRRLPNIEKPSIRIAYFSSWITSVWLEHINRFHHLGIDEMEKIIEEAITKTMKRWR